MSISTTIKDIRKLLDSNSPIILTGMAVSGTLLSVYLTYKGTQKGTLAIAQEARERNMSDSPTPISNIEKVNMTWRGYVPAAFAVVGTCTCMVMATKIGLNRTAALAGALVIAERNNDQYKDKVKEVLGQNKHTKVADAVAQDQVAAIPSGALPLPRDGEQTYLDAWSGRSISTTRENMDKAVNDFNHDMLYGKYASLSEFYKRVGLPDIQTSDSVGWNKQALLELAYTAVLKDDRPITVFTFDRAPSATFRDDDI